METIKILLFCAILIISSQDTQNQNIFVLRLKHRNKRNHAASSPVQVTHEINGNEPKISAAMLNPKINVVKKLVENVVPHKSPVLYPINNKLAEIPTKYNETTFLVDLNHNSQEISNPTLEMQDKKEIKQCKQPVEEICEKNVAPINVNHPLAETEHNKKAESPVYTSHQPIKVKNCEENLSHVTTHPLAEIGHSDKDDSPNTITQVPSKIKNHLLKLVTELTPKIKPCEHINQVPVAHTPEQSENNVHFQFTTNTPSKSKEIRKTPALVRITDGQKNVPSDTTHYPSATTKYHKNNEMPVIDTHLPAETVHLDNNEHSLDSTNQSMTTEHCEKKNIITDPHVDIWGNKNNLKQNIRTDSIHNIHVDTKFQTEKESSSKQPITESVKLYTNINNILSEVDSKKYTPLIPNNQSDIQGQHESHKSKVCELEYNEEKPQKHGLSCEHGTKDILQRVDEHKAMKVEQVSLEDTKMSENPSCSKNKISVQDLHYSEGHNHANRLKSHEQVKFNEDEPTIIIEDQKYEEILESSRPKHDNADTRFYTPQVSNYGTLNYYYPELLYPNNINPELNFDNNQRDITDAVIANNNYCQCGNVNSLPQNYNFESNNGNDRIWKIWKSQIQIKRIKYPISPKTIGLQNYMYYDPGTNVAKTATFNQRPLAIGLNGYYRNQNNV